MTTVKQLPAPGLLGHFDPPAVLFHDLLDDDNPIPVPASPDSSAFLVR